MAPLLTLLVATLCSAGDPAVSPDTLYYQIRMGGSVVGRISTVTTQEADGTVRRYDRTEMTMAREGITISFEEETSSIEDGGGDLLWYEVVRRGLGPNDWVDTLGRIGEGWRRSRDRGGAPMTDTLSSIQIAGPVGIERMLAAGPESTRFVALDPVEFAPRRVEARLLRMERPDSTVETPACRVFAVRDTDSEEELLQWRDPEGILWREEASLLGWVVEREEFARGGDGATFEAMAWVRLPVVGRVPSAGPCRLTVLPVGEHIAPAGEKPFPSGSTQTVTRGKQPGSWQISLEPGNLPATSEADRRRWREDPSLASSLEPGLMIDSDSPAILRFAKRAVTQCDSPTEEARALERAVHQRIEVRDLGTLFATASQTLNHRTGDCTEHAILLAASCRALGIPARLVAGIVPYGGQMQFHLWTEVYLGRWCDLDATLGRARRAPCAVGLLRWDRPEDGIKDLTTRVQSLVGQYRFLINAEP